MTARVIPTPVLRFHTAHVRSAKTTINRALFRGRAKGKASVLVTFRRYHADHSEAYVACIVRYGDNCIDGFRALTVVGECDPVARTCGGAKQ